MITHDLFDAWKDGPLTQGKLQFALLQRQTHRFDKDNIRHDRARKNTRKYKTRRHTTRTPQDKTDNHSIRQDKTKQDKARQGKTRQGKARQKVRYITTLHFLEIRRLYHHQMYPCRESSRFDETRQDQDKTKSRQVTNKSG